MLLEVALDIVSKWNLPAFASARVPEMVQRWREGRQLRGGGGGGGGGEEQQQQQHRHFARPPAKTNSNIVASSAVEFVVL